MHILLSVIMKKVQWNWLLYKIYAYRMARL